MIDSEQFLDVRDLPPRERHPRIFAQLDHLPRGGVLQLVNDHDPQPLWYQLQAERPGQFTWTYWEHGPERWSVGIERVGEAPAPALPAAPAHSALMPAARRAGPYLDNRGLEPPEPLVRILDALSALDPAAELTAHLDREPLLLYPHLLNRGFAHAIVAEADGSYLLRIWREDAGA